MCIIETNGKQIFVSEGRYPFTFPGMSETFFRFKEHGLLFIAFWLTYLPARITFGPKGKTTSKRTFEKIAKKKETSAAISRRQKRHIPSHSADFLISTSFMKSVSATSTTPLTS